MRFLFLGILVIILFILDIFIGPVDIPASRVMDILGGDWYDTSPEAFIIVHSRFPQAVTAMLAGASLAVCGLMLQTSFRNPLAGPSILGITSGASLGVAVVMLALGGAVSIGGYAIGGYMAVIAGAFAGSIFIMGLLLMLSSWLKNNLLLLITGIIIGYLTSSVITLLNYSSTAQGVHGYTMWGMGTFNSVSLSQLPLFASVTAVGIFMSCILVKPLNLLLLGDNYARNLGINLKLVRNLLLVATGILTAVTTSYCGPVSFVGLAVPHIARLMFRTDDHRILIPATLLSGAAVTLGCCLISILPAQGVIPVNAVTPLIGAPVIIYVILRRR